MRGCEAGTIFCIRKEESQLHVLEAELSPYMWLLPLFQKLFINVDVNVE